MAYLFKNNTMKTLNTVAKNIIRSASTKAAKNAPRVLITGLSILLQNH